MQCKGQDCTDDARVRGWCQRHYLAEWRRLEREGVRDALPPLICAYCGDEYKPARYRTPVTAESRSKFCSRKCKEKARQATPEFKAELLRRYYERRYRLSMDEVAEIRSTGCGICGAAAGSGRWDGQLHIDHDHDTGRVRGALCHGCNVSLGHFRHDPELLRKAIVYLER